MNMDYRQLGPTDLKVNSYGKWGCEEILGNTLERGGRRHQVVLATKFNLDMSDDLLATSAGIGSFIKKFESPLPQSDEAKR